MRPKRTLRQWFAYKTGLFTVKDWAEALFGLVILLCAVAFLLATVALIWTGFTHDALWAKIAGTAFVGLFAFWCYAVLS